MLSIRTQNRMALVPYNSFILIEDEYINWDFTGKYAIVLNKFKLGAYATQERALEVLYEIETAIEKNNFTNYKYFDGDIEKVVEYKYKLQTIYQMPKE